ncbi:MAG: penicillin acylase family protein [Proteobacteria bacterium]|nr:penicillin acylase family protein [Pseudomonadota bacterium]
MRKLKILGVVLVLLLVSLLLLGYLALRGSLPRLDGQLALAGLGAPVHIERDARGVPTIEAANRADLAFATGFLHAQDRFFEMDLSRRLAGGELSELFGTVALAQDRRARLFRFRSVAQAVLAQAAPGQRAAMEAYARGVNAGLAALGARPWEYWLLGQKPRPWATEDGILVVYAMWWDLQAEGFRRGIVRRQVNARLGGAECADGWKCALAFFYPPGTNWDAPAGRVPEGAASEPAIPGPEAINVRAAPGVAGPTHPSRAPAVGSNNWAVGGQLTATGAALLANDMHLTQRVPTIWYHARLKVSAGAGDNLVLDGVTLPGGPLLVAGSNGRLAWGFTNSYGNWLDVERVDCSAVQAGRMTTPGGVVPLSVISEEIKVKGAPTAVLDVQSGPRGTLVRVDERAHECWFGSWLAQRPEATNMNLMQLEHAGSVQEALQLAPQIGIPHQNAMLADRDGHIAWTIFGRIPEDTSSGRALAAGPWTTFAEHPRIVDPPLGRLWSANARVASDPRQLQLIGGDLAALGAEYDLGARAGQIRDDLLARQGPFAPADMLRIQLDDRAVFLARWQALALSVSEAAGADPRHAQFHRLVAGWNAHASVDSVGYRLVRAFHDRTQQAVWDMLLAGLAITPDEGSYPPSQFEGPLWQLVTKQPLHLLSSRYASWSDFLRAQLDATLEELGGSCPQLEQCTWGAHDRVRIRHPLSGALPGLAGFLDMPTVELPGDQDMPRVQVGNLGASERLAVSPGHEDQAYLTLPGGQSGHPLSPYYRAGFLAWAHGETLPLVPGPAQHTLTLVPR